MKEAHPTSTRRLDVLFEGWWMPDGFDDFVHARGTLLSMLSHSHYYFVSAIGLFSIRSLQSRLLEARCMGSVIGVFLPRYLRHTESNLKELCHHLISKTCTIRVSYSAVNTPNEKRLPSLYFCFTAKSTQVSKHIDSIHSILSRGSSQSHYNLGFLTPSKFPQDEESP